MLNRIGNSKFSIRLDAWPLRVLHTFEDQLAALIFKNMYVLKLH